MIVQVNIMTTARDQPPIQRDAAFSGDSRAKVRYVQGMFGRIAGGYDRMNALMTLGRDRAWRRQVARLADQTPDTPALDVCCGTGDQALALAELGRGPVVGIDFASPMVRIARGKADRSGARAVSFAEGDALRLPFADNTFSAVTTSFALRNVADVAAFLGEMRRVAKPGGRIATLELFGPPKGPLSPLGRIYLKVVVPAVGKLVAGDGDAYTYLPQSTRFVPSPEEFSARMAAARLERVTYRPLALGGVAIHVGTKPA